MPVWPFRRKSRRKRPRSDTPSDPSPIEPDAPEDQVQTRRRKTDFGSQTQPPTKRQPNKLHRRERSYSFEKGREDALAIERRKTSRKRSTAAALQGSLDPHAHPYSKHIGAPNSQTHSFDQDNFSRMPTLHNKRNAEHLSRKKTSKRRKSDHAREAEIRAMSSLEPVRPAAESWQSGRPLKRERDGRRVRTTMGLGFRRSFEKEQPNSDVSLPLPGSIHSSLSSDSEQVAFRVSALEALAPRPTLRYTVNPRYGSPPRDRPTRHVSVKNKVAERQPIPEATLKAHKRVDDLADDLTASDLRELMEREDRRRARKRERDQERIERRLARKAEKERAAERQGQPSQPNMERGVFGRESVGLGIEPESAVVTSSTPRSSTKSSQRSSPGPTSKQLGKRPAAEMEDDDEAADEAAQGPLAHFHRTESVPLDNVEDRPSREEPPTRRESSPRKKIILMPRSSRSASPQPPPDAPKTEAPDPARKGSGGSMKRLRRSWSNLFRWGSKSRRKSGPSSFSNTSRDSMSNTHVPIAAPIPAALTRKLSSNVPKRTLSRFREDLPELPVSPPQSREPSPAPLPSAIMEVDSPELDGTVDAVNHQTKRRDTPMSPDEGYGSVPASVPASLDPSPEPVETLASIDSEGSWFGKRTATRRSIPTTPLTPPLRRQRAASFSSDDSHDDPDLPKQLVEDDASDIDVANDEYLSRFANQRSSGSHVTNARPSSDASDNARWGIVGGRQPNVVEPHAGNFVKSREGLLNTFSDAGNDNGSDAGDDNHDLTADAEIETNGLFRADSAKRHKGTAKMMNITPPRASVDGKRLSSNTNFL